MAEGCEFKETVSKKGAGTVDRDLRASGHFSGYLSTAAGLDESHLSASSSAVFVASTADVTQRQTEAQTGTGAFNCIGSVSFYGTEEIFCEYRKWC